MMRRLISCVLVLVMMGINFCSAAELQLPLNTKVIDEEAFRGAASIDTVVAPDGITNIESRAFADSSVREMNLPGSLTYIADDAFEGCSDNLMLLPDYGSYAHQWCQEHDMLYHTDGLGGSVPESAHAVHSVDYDGQAEEAGFVANISTTDECVLVVEVQDDAGSSLIDRLEETVQANLSGAEIRMAYEKTMPENYRLEAWLQDASGTALCEPYINIHHTQAYEEFMNQTAADYPADRVLDYGDSGYIVLADNVKKLGVKATANADGNYTFKTGADLKAGDVIVVIVDGVQTPMKIGSITENAAGTVTVVESDDVALEELFSLINIGASSGGRDGEPEGLEIPYEIPSTSITTSLASINVSGDGTLIVDVDLLYNPYKFGEDYFEIGVTVKNRGTISVGLKESVDTYKDKNAPSIEVYDGLAAIPGTPIVFPLRIAIALNIKAEAGGVFNFSVNQTAGFTYNPINELKTFKDGEIERVDPEPKGKVEFYIGPEASMNFDLFKCIIARVGFHEGMFLRLVNLSGLSVDDSGIGTDSYHACDFCINGDAGLYFWPRITLKAKLIKGISMTGIDLGEALMWSAKKLYASVVNEEESLFEGALHAGEGECPNWKYRTDIYTQNLEGEIEDGLPVTITGGRLKASEYGASPYSTYLYPGKYKASTIFSPAGAAVDFAILDFARVIFIEEEGATINGVVLNNTTEEPISGAHISLTGENGKTYETTTDSEGNFLIEKVREGTYDYYVTKQGFRDLEVEKLKYTAGTNASVKLHMVPKNVPFISTGNLIYDDSARIQALTADGDCPAGVPEVYLTVDGKTGTGYQKIIIEHELCDEPYVFTNTTGRAAQLFGIDMGDGEYTFVLKILPVGTSSGRDNYVFRVENGELKRIKDFDVNGLPDNISVNGQCTSNRYFGTLMPLGNSIQGGLYSSDSARNGLPLLSSERGTLNYELRDDGYYNLVFNNMQYCRSFFEDDYAGTSYTRYVMVDGVLTIDAQWHVPYWSK